ncbi:MAG: hypothetical protein ACI9YT_002220 [Halobacteriales archaeon]|jgi:hypothetical protein
MKTTGGVATPEWVPLDPSILPGDPVFTVSVAVLGLLALVAGVRSSIRYFRIRAPATPILSLAADGRRVEVSGVARPRDDEPLRSPFTDTACLVCRSTVEAYYPSVVGDADSIGLDEFLTPDGWRPLHDKTAAVPFYVDDGTASVLVGPHSADLAFETHETTFRVGDPLPDPIREFVESAFDAGDAPWAKRLFQDRRRSRLDTIVAEFELAGPTEWRFVEERLDVGSSVHVLGVASPRRTAPDEVGVVHAVVGKPSRPLTDGSGGGHVVRRSRVPFVISDASETDVEADLRLSALLELGAGTLVLGVWTVYVLGYLPV